MDPAQDNGFQSRKLVLCSATAVLLALAYLAQARWPALTVGFPTLAAALVSLVGVYSGMNLGEKFILGRVAQGQSDTAAVVAGRDGDRADAVAGIQVPEADPSVREW